MATRARVLLGTVAVCVTAAAVAAVLLYAAPEAGDDEPGTDYRPHTLGSLDTGAITVTRGPLCDGVPEEAVHQALGREPAQAREYGNGDLTKLTPQVRDIAHEYGCAWRTPRITAMTWVFAPPVSQQRARELARAAADRSGCRRIDGAAGFGRPSSATLCEADGELLASYQGLFGDAWLACQISSRGRLDRSRVERRADHWCAAVLGQFS